MQIGTHIEAVKTVDPFKALGKHHTLWLALAKLCENLKDFANAKLIFDRAVQETFKTVDNLASLWCEWAEMERRCKNYGEALDLMKRATSTPMNEVKQREFADGSRPVQMNLHKCPRLWTLYLDLEEGLGTLESTRAVYEQLFDLKIITPQVLLNYAFLLEGAWNF